MSAAEEPMIAVRVASLDEAPAIGALTHEVYRRGGFLDDDEEYAAELLDAAGRIRDAVVLVALLADEIVAAVAVVEPGSAWADIARPDEIEVRMLAVAETARRRGVADRLMGEVEARARRQGRSGVALSTERVMVAAHALYERRGYVRRPERDWSFQAVELLVYRLDL